VTAVGSPVHRVYFGQMSPERTPGLHYDARQVLEFLGGHCAH
jgi:hypothetical protein